MQLGQALQLCRCMLFLKNGGLVEEFFRTFNVNRLQAVICLIDSD
jgi:hypothetical protein